MSTGGELVAAAAWQAWKHVTAEFGATHRVYGVAMHSAGDTIFQLASNDRIQVVSGGGLLATNASPADLALIDRCIADGNFMTCVQERGGARSQRPVLRVYPGLEPGWSIKSLHPSRGGRGSVSATVVR